ncbi:MAG: class I SAM-dependent methyltransferase [Candidatus Omnitrophota bacterium]|jgi:SAM-dependent methyltransferase
MPKVAQFLPDAKSLNRDKGVDLGVCQCSGCGLVQLDSRPVPYYKEVIRAAGISEEMRRFRAKQFSAFVRNFSLKNKKVIEIGCGNGEYLSIMQQAGVIAYGLEYSNRSVKRCVKKGLKAIQGFIQNSAYKIKYAPFDAFFILNFLEHLPDPNSTLRGIYNNLTDGGVGIVEVPNLDMILRNKLFSEFMRDHLCYFTRDTLTLLLELNGFEVIGCKEAWHEYTISAVVKKRRKEDLTGFSNRQTQLKNGLERYVRKFRGKGVAIWGAGHQALAAISLLGLAGKIKYVIDSAPFKQGKFTPATHLRIVAPEALVREPVAAVIIMAASYSDEVAGILRAKSSRHKTLNIAILRANKLEIVHPKGI